MQNQDIDKGVIHYDISSLSNEDRNKSSNNHTLVLSKQSINLEN